MKKHLKEIAKSFMYLSYWYDYLSFPCSLSSVRMKPMIFVSRHHKRAEINFSCKTCNQLFSTVNNTITIKLIIEIFELSNLDKVYFKLYQAVNNNNSKK